jgi:hypothetical protein
VDILLITSLVLVVFLVILSIFLNKYAEFWYRLLVTNRLALINSIILTEEVPAVWRVPLLDGAASRGTSLFWRKVRWLLYAWYLYRLDRLCSLIRNSSFIKKDDKHEFLEALAQIRSDWASQKSAGLSN